MDVGIKNFVQTKTKKVVSHYKMSSTLREMINKVKVES